MNETQKKQYYNELLALLAKAELAARNGEWLTCGTLAKNVTNRAYEIGKLEKEAGKSQPNPL